mmetsp:Transcript_26442/g.71423  ORF Transcript_26442/g.71423 Transcript_26442/m.71423 type:complete len:221 (+) Transcript_26442:2594-3256(+)
MARVRWVCTGGGSVEGWDWSGSTGGRRGWGGWSGGTCREWGRSGSSGCSPCRRWSMCIGRMYAARSRMHSLHEHCQRKHNFKRSLSQFAQGYSSPPVAVALQAGDDERSSKDLSDSQGNPALDGAIAHAHADRPTNILDVQVVDIGSVGCTRRHRRHAAAGRHHIEIDCRQQLRPSQARGEVWQTLQRMIDLERFDCIESSIAFLLLGERVHRPVRATNS